MTLPMAHFLYHTDGFILGSRPSGEAGRWFDLFTNRFGRVRALAAGVREFKSKLRYSLSELALVKISLVRGRGVWRIVYVEAIQAKPFDQAARQAAARLFKLLVRLVIDEGRRRRVWQEIFGAYRFLSQTSFTPVELADFELLVVWRILAALGYCQTSPRLAPFASRPWDKLLISDFNVARATARLIVDQALYHSHL